MAVHPRKSENPEKRVDNNSIRNAPFSVWLSAPGQSLLELLDLEVISQQAAVKIILALAETLHPLHCQQLAYGQITLANVMVDANGYPHLLNPPQPMDLIHSPEADLICLGGMLYELLTGQPPGIQPASMISLDRTISPELEMIHAKTLPNTTQKYLSCAELASDLRYFLTASHYPSDRLPFGARFLTRWRADRWVATALVILAVLGLVLIPFLLVQLVRQSQMRHTAELVNERMQLDHEEVIQTRIRSDQEQRDAQVARSLAEQAVLQLQREKSVLEEAMTVARQSQLKSLDENNRLQQRLQTESQALYLQYLVLAKLALQNGLSDTALQWLDQCLPTHSRGWEWYYLRGEATKTSPSTGWRRLAFRPPDGRWLAWASGKTIILRRRVASPSTNDIRIVEAPEPVLSIAFTADGRFLVAGCRGGAVRAWDVTANEALVVFRDRHEGQVLAVACSSDAQMVATAGQDRTIHLTRVGLGEWKTRILAEMHPSAITWLSFDPTSRQIASASQDGNSRLWSLETGNDVHPPREDTNLIAFQTQGRLHAIGRGNGSVTLLNPDEKQVSSFPGSHDLRDLVFTRNDRAVTLDHQGNVTAWEIRSPDPALEILGVHSMGGCAVSPEGDYLAWMPDSHTVRLRSLGNPVVASWNWIQATGKNITVAETVPPLLATISDPVAMIAWNPSGQRLLTLNHLKNKDDNHVGGHFRLWDGSSGRLLSEWKEERHSVKTMAIGSQGAIAWAGSSGQIDLLEGPADGKRFSLDGHDGTVQFLLFSPDGNWLATAGSDRRLIVWDLVTRKIQHTVADTEVVGGIAFSADNKFLFAGRTNGQISQWEIDRLTPVRKLQMPNNQLVQGLIADPKGEWILAWSNRGSLQTWRIMDGQPLKTVPGIPDGILALAVNPNQNRLAIACRDRTIRIWNSSLMTEILSLESEYYLGSSLAFHPDGLELTAATSRGVRRWLAPRVP